MSLTICPAFGRVAAFFATTALCLVAHAQTPSGGPPSADTDAAPPSASPASPAPPPYNAGATASGDASLSAVGSAPTMTSNGAPKAARGFQMALRTGVSIPFGKASGDDDDSMSDLFSAQVPLIIDVGGKLGEYVFLGGYLGLGVGGVAGQTSDLCDAANAKCLSTTVRIGVQAQVHFAPAEKVNPWLGYGIGWEASSVAIRNDGVDSSVSTSGPEFAHFMGGVDFRLSRTVGIGPFVDMSLGQYSRIRIETDEFGASGDVDKKALHGWLTLGARLVFFP